MVRNGQEGEAKRHIQSHRDRERDVLRDKQGRCYAERKERQRLKSSKSGHRKRDKDITT